VSARAWSTAAEPDRLVPRGAGGQQLLAERLGAQLLAGERAADALGVAARILALQAQNQRGVRMAVRARSAGAGAGEVDRALTAERAMVITWLNRGTLHLVRSEDYNWLHSLTAPGLFTANARRISQEGVSPAQADRAVRAIVRSLGADGPLTREQLGDRVRAARVPTEGQALIHLLMLASLRGLIVRGPMDGRNQRYVLVRDWLGEQPRVERDVALAELARRFLRGHGPAGERDLARWSGLALGEVRAGLGAAAGEITEREDGLLEIRGAAPPATVPPPALLGAFDPVLFGWCSREWVTGPHEREIAVGGLFRPFAMIRGRAAATWSMTAGELTLKPLRRISAAERADLALDSQDLSSRMAGWLA